MSSFWKTFGSALASVATYAAKGAIWASDHPEVIAQVSNIAVAAGAPAPIVAGVDKGLEIAGAAAAVAQAATRGQ